MVAMGDLSGFVSWLDKQPSGTQGLVLLGLTTIVAFIGWVFCVALPWLWRMAFRSTSRYERWMGLADQFYDIAKRDNEVVLPTEKRKVSTVRYQGDVKFRGGSQSHHATEAEALSRVAGRLLRKSRVPHRRYWRGIDPRVRWVDFVTDSIKAIDLGFAKTNITDLSDDRSTYVAVEVFPFAAHLVCKHCASFEKLPTP
jgi:hypothetical protein